MRKTAEMLSLVALAMLAYITMNIFQGSHPLPVTIPTNFDEAGHPNGWGSRSSLFFFPVFASAFYLLFSVIARFSSKFNYPVQVNELSRKQLEGLALNLLAWIKAQVIIFSVWMEYRWVQSVRHPELGFKPYPAFVFLGFLFATIIGHIVAMFRAGNPSGQQV